MVPDLIYYWEVEREGSARIINKSVRLKIINHIDGQ